MEISAPQIERLIEVVRQSHDFVVLDLERVLDAVAIKALDMADLIIPVMEAMLPFVRDASRLVRALRSLGYGDSKLGLLVNRHQSGSEISLADIESAVNLKVAHTVPNSFKEVAHAINTGVPLVKDSPSNPVTRALRTIAEELLGRPKPARHGWLGRLVGQRV